MINHSEILIHEVKITDIGVIDITYELLSADIKATSSECGILSPNFRKAMNALIDEVIDICLLDRSRWIEAEITCVAFRLRGEAGYKVTAKNHKSPVLSPLTVTTPKLDSIEVSDDFKAKLEAIQKEAQAVVAQSLEEKKQNPQCKKGRTLAEMRQLLGTEESAGDAV